MGEDKDLKEKIGEEEDLRGRMGGEEDLRGRMGEEEDLRGRMGGEEDLRGRMGDLWINRSFKMGENGLLRGGLARELVQEVLVAFMQRPLMALLRGEGRKGSGKMKDDISSGGVLTFSCKCGEAEFSFVSELFFTFLDVSLGSECIQTSASFDFSSFVETFSGEIKLEKRLDLVSASNKSASQVVLKAPISGEKNN